MEPVDQSDRTPLFNAARMANREDIHTLLNAVADPHMPDRHGRTPAHLAAIKTKLKNQKK